MIHPRLFAPLALFTAMLPASAAPATCATIDLGKILQLAKPSLSFQAALQAEYEPRFATLEPLRLARSKAETALLEGKLARLTPEAMQALQRTHDDAVKALSAAQLPIERAFKQSKTEALHALLALTGDAYQRLGREGNFSLLFQEGEPEPAYVLDTGMRRERCASKTDLTQPVLDALAGPGGSVRR